jgi:hypothetical protein
MKNRYEFHCADPDHGMPEKRVVTLKGPLEDLLPQVKKHLEHGPKAVGILARERGNGAEECPRRIVIADAAAGTRVTWVIASTRNRFGKPEFWPFNDTMRTTRKEAWAAFANWSYAQQKGLPHFKRRGFRAVKVFVIPTSEEIVS